MSFWLRFHLIVFNFCADGTNVAKKLIDAGLARRPQEVASTRFVEILISFITKYARVLYFVTLQLVFIMLFALLFVTLTIFLTVLFLHSPPVKISRSPDEKKREEIKQRFSAYGWPADLNHLIGRRMTTEIVDYEPNGDLWIRFDPLPGHTAPPMMRLLATDTCLFAERHGHIKYVCQIIKSFTSSAWG